MLDITVRAVEPQDAEAIRDIYACSNAQSNTLQLPFPSKTLWTSRLNDIPDNMHFFVAEIDNDVVGTIGLMTNSNPRRKHCADFGMGVRDDAQDQGVGSALLSAITDLADNWLNIQRIEIAVFTDNQPAIRLYEKFGFEIEGEAKDYAFRDGEYVDVYYMARNIR